MFLFSWFMHLLPLIYFYLRGVNSAPFWRPTIFAPFLCPPSLTGSWFMDHWNCALPLQIKKSNNCRNNEMIALRISATFCTPRTAALKKISVDRKGNGMVACEPLRFLPRATPRQIKKGTHRSGFLSISWSWKFICFLLTCLYNQRILSY